MKAKMKIFSLQKEEKRKIFSFLNKNPSTSLEKRHFGEMLGIQNINLFQRKFRKNEP